ncbi:MAG: hypothetical protein JWP35_3882 [Caulobacter sp.]|nr:hypothetical protein [Caulobacter sp.]
MAAGIAQRAALIGLVTLLLGPSAAQAAEAPLESASAFFGCDGYDRPKGGDGVSGQMAIFGPLPMSGFGRRQRGGDDAAAAVTDCGAALTVLPKAFPLRRANLLLNRALHQMRQGNAPAALTDLAEAESAAGKAGGLPDYQRSLGVGLNLLRAKALRMLGRDQEADGALARAIDLRPFDVHTLTLASDALGPGADPVLSARVSDRLLALRPHLRSRRETSDPWLVWQSDLPELQLARQRPPWRDGGHFLGFKGSYNEFMSVGFSRTDDPRGFSIAGYRTQGLGDVAEEMALLQAADMARQAGKWGFVVLDRRAEPLKVNEVTSSYGAVVRDVTLDAGYRAELAVVFLDKDEAPPPVLTRGRPVRVLEAAAVYSALAPIYMARKS